MTRNEKVLRGKNETDKGGNAELIEQNRKKFFSLDPFLLLKESER